MISCPASGSSFTPRRFEAQRFSQAQTIATAITPRTTVIAIAHVLTRIALVVWRAASFRAISRLRCLVSWSEELIGRSPLKSRFQVRTVQVLAVVAAFNVASVDDAWPAAPRPAPVSRLSENDATAAHSA